MALYNIDSLKTLYTKIGSKFDTCYLCEKEIKQKFNDKKITLDEMNNELKKLVGQLNAKKIAYLEYSGVTLHICKDCLEKIYSEINTTYNINSNANTNSNKNINKVENKKEDNSKLKINLKKDKQNASKSK